ncbi:hypothetical protein TrVGV298_005959 [Trichoderma virens]|nr:hypothetical protein TrVGV298_005959 [Trichoderma virens]
MECLPPHIAIPTCTDLVAVALHQDSRTVNDVGAAYRYRRYRRILAEHWPSAANHVAPLQRRIDSDPTPLESGLNLHSSNISLPLPDSPSSTSSIASTSPSFPPPARAARFLAVAISPDAAAASGASSYHALRAVIYQSLTARRDPPSSAPLAVLPRSSAASIGSSPAAAVKLDDLIFDLTMASSSFRDSINSLGWSRRQDAPITTSQQSSGLLASLQNLNPFQDRGYTVLPTSEGPGAPLPAPSRREEEEGWFVLSRWDRMLVFAFCNLAAAACFVICFTLFPVLSLRPRKFVILWTVGSALFLASFAAIMGPMNYVYHLFSAPRLPFTAAYFGSIALTLVFSIKLQNTILTLFAALAQLAALLWYLVSYFPMGSTGLRLATSYGARQATSWLSG